MHPNRSALRSVPSITPPAALVAMLAGGLVSPLALAQNDTNIGRYRFASGSSADGNAGATFALDGKLGPENQWLTGTRGRHRLNIFFDRPTEIGSVHVYSGGERDGPADTMNIQYLNLSGSLVDVPGASVTGNTEWFRAFEFASAVTTTQIQLFVNDNTATIREVAVFPPDASPAPMGTGVNAHLARQHRIPFTTASSTVNGSSRRAVVDGFVNDTDYWQASASGNQWIALDIRDPDETTPVSVRATTTPIEIGSVHLYSGLETGAAPIARGRFQTLDENSGVWLDVPGGSFANNTQRELEVMFDAPVTTPTLRLLVQDAGGIVREVVPLPPNDGLGWPIGTGVIEGEETDAVAFGDRYHTIALAGDGLALTSESGGATVLRPETTMLPQHYQVLLNVGTDTYRIRSRVTGDCLEPQNGSFAPDAPVVEAEYQGLPTQRWRMESVAGGVRFVNAASGHILSAATLDDGSGLTQRASVGPGQAWVLTERDHAVKKGQGGYPQLGDKFESEWAYNWGPNDNFPETIEFWPMQWGSFFWSQRPALLPEYLRNGEAIVLMGYNEPDKTDQANLAAPTAVAMWPRLEAMNMPLLGPAVAGHPATSPWIQDFMAEAAAEEMRIDYVGMHAYPGPNVNSFIQRITDAHNAWGRDVVVSEFSVVDWSNTNSWNNDAVYNFFLEVLWRMEKLPYVHRYAVFTFVDDPANPISDNRGEMLEADGVTLTPEGRYYAAWDADTQIRTDTPYHLHNDGSKKRIGMTAGAPDADAIVLGNRTNAAERFQWRLIPAATPGRFNIESVEDGRILVYSGQGLELQAPGASPSIAEFELVEIEHGWFAIQESQLDRRLSSTASQVSLAAPGTTSDSVRWRFVPVYDAPPGPPRGGSAVSIGADEVALAWATHGFRDLLGFNIYRSGPSGGPSRLIASNVMTESFIDAVPEPGTYVYTVTANGDTGESDASPLGTVNVDTCPADFDADFAADGDDVLAAIAAINAGLDYDGNGVADFFDTLAFLRVFDEGCPGN